MLPLIAILLPMMLIFLGFAVDLAYMQNTRLELRAVTDAAARAAATTLSRTDDTSQARQAAKRIARRNSVAGKSLSLTNADIEFGRTNRSGSGKYVFTEGNRPFNAVRVTGDRRAGSRTGAVSLFFGRVFGASQFEPKLLSTASFLNLDITLVLDRSGSMQGQKIDDLKSAVDAFLDELDDTHAYERVGLASYSTNSQIDANLTMDYWRIRRAVNDFNAYGDTAIGKGLNDGISVVTGAGSRRSATPIIILMTDGIHNTGYGPMGPARDAAADGIRVYTITFGDDADRRLMQDVAAETGGRHQHADNGRELIAVFRELAAMASQLTD